MSDHKPNSINSIYPLSQNQVQKWTQDILGLMCIVIISGCVLLSIGMITGVFLFNEILPIYVLTLLTIPVYLISKKYNPYWVRFFPATICFFLGIYLNPPSGFASSGLLYALSILLAGMLAGPKAQWFMVFLSIFFYTYFGLNKFGFVRDGDLAAIFTFALVIIGISLLQWYFDRQLRKALHEQIGANQNLLDEVARRIQAEASLKEQESQLRRLADNTTDLVTEISIDGTMHYVSPSYFNTGGYKPEELLGTNAFDRVHPDDLGTVFNTISETIEQKKPQAAVLRFKHKAGHYLYVESAGSPLINEDGEVTGFVISSRDITAQRLAEDAINESESRFNHVIESLPMGVHLYHLTEDDNLILRGYNPAAEKILGISHQNLLNKTIEEAFPNLTETEVPGIYRNIARLGIAWNTDQIIYNDSTITGSYEVHAFQTSPSKMASVFLDVTHRAQASKALLDSEEKFSKAFVTSPDSVNINRLRDGLYLDINDGFTKITGYTKEEVTGKSSLDLNIWADPADRKRLVHALQEFGYVNNLEAAFRYKDGSIRTGLMSASIIEIDQEKCILSITRDITERIQVEDELRETHKQLEIAYDATLKGWVSALELREHETAQHSRRVVDMTVRMASLYGFSGENLSKIERGSLLHDIGKMGVPDSILLKPGPLSEDEWVIMRSHPQFAYDFMSKIPYLADTIDIPFCHHERWDGTGYPRKIAGEEIPISARIFTVVDIYDALLSNRPYRQAWQEADVIQYLADQRGKIFDPQIVDQFLQLIDHHS